MILVILIPIGNTITLLKYTVVLTELLYTFACIEYYCIYATLDSVVRS